MASRTTRRGNIEHDAQMYLNQRGAQKKKEYLETMFPKESYQKKVVQTAESIKRRQKEVKLAQPAAKKTAPKKSARPKSVQTPKPDNLKDKEQQKWKNFIAYNESKNAAGKARDQIPDFQLYKAWSHIKKDRDNPEKKPTLGNILDGQYIGKPGDLRALVNQIRREHGLDSIKSPLPVGASPARASALPPESNQASPLKDKRASPSNPPLPVRGSPARASSLSAEFNQASPLKDKRTSPRNPPSKKHLVKSRSVSENTKTKYKEKYKNWLHYLKDNTGTNPMKVIPHFELYLPWSNIKRANTKQAAENKPTLENILSNAYKPKTQELREIVDHYQRKHSHRLDQDPPHNELRESPMPVRRTPSPRQHTSPVETTGNSNGGAGEFSPAHSADQHVDAGEMWSLSPEKKSASNSGSGTPRRLSPEKKRASNRGSGTSRTPSPEKKRASNNGSGTSRTPSPEKKRASNSGGGTSRTPSPEKRASNSGSGTPRPPIPENRASNGGLILDSLSVALSSPHTRHQSPVAQQGNSASHFSNQDLNVPGINTVNNVDRQKYFKAIGYLNHIMGMQISNINKNVLKSSELTAYFKNGNVIGLTYNAKLHHTVKILHQRKLERLIADCENESKPTMRAILNLARIYRFRHITQNAKGEPELTKQFHRGSTDEVYFGIAETTSYGETSDNMVINYRGYIVDKKRHDTAVLLRRYYKLKRGGANQKPGEGQPRNEFGRYTNKEGTHHSSYAGQKGQQRRAAYFDVRARRRARSDPKERSF